MKRYFILACSLILGFLQPIPALADSENDGVEVQFGLVGHNIERQDNETEENARGGSITLGYQYFILDEVLSFNLQLITFDYEIEYSGSDPQDKEILHSAHPVLPALQIRYWIPYPDEKKFIGFHIGRYKQVVGFSDDEDRSKWSLGYGFEIQLPKWLLFYSLRFDSFKATYENSDIKPAKINSYRLNIVGYRW